MNIGIIGFVHKKEVQRILKRILTRFGKGNKFFIYEGIFERSPRYKIYSLNEIISSVSLIVSIGGDGTILALARELRGKTIPVLPVKLGGLGFLTQFTEDELFLHFSDILKGKGYLIEKRMMISGSLKGVSRSINFECLNEVVVSKSSKSRMLKIKVSVDGKFLTQLPSDGLIISTPTGSTGHSLSAGGPIIHPLQDLFTITPICAHMLTNRPIVIPAASKISIEIITKFSDVFITIDGQVNYPVEEDDLIIVRKSPHRIHLIRQKDKDFFSVLRTKLGWGMEEKR